MNEITKIKINKVFWEKWLIWFAEVVINDSIFIGWIGIFSRLSEPEKIRLVFPTKKKGDKDIKICYPMTNELYRLMEGEIQKEYDRS